MTKPKAKRQPRKKPVVALDRQARFVEEFMVDRNATQAAIRAGYSPKTAGVQGCQLLKRLNIQADVKERATEQTARLAVTADRVMQEYERLALLDPIDLFNPDGSMKPLHEIPEDARRAISGLEIRQLKDIEAPDSVLLATLHKIKLADKKGALDSLAKIMGLMRDQPATQVNVGVTVQVQQESRERVYAKLLG